MDFLSLAKQRCSVRKYKKDAIEKEKIDKILEVARIAPTAANMQSHRLLVVSSNEELQYYFEQANAASIVEEGQQKKYGCRISNDTNCCCDIHVFYLTSKQVLTIIENIR